MRTKIASMKYLLYFIAAVMMFGSSGIVASTLPLSAFEVCLMRLIIGALFMLIVYLLSKIILEKNAQSISMTKILGYSNREIADMLAISVKTVETHRANIMRKHNFKNITELVLFAVRNHIIEP